MKCNLRHIRCALKKYGYVVLIFIFLHQIVDCLLFKNCRLISSRCDFRVLQAEIHMNHRNIENNSDNLTIILSDSDDENKNDSSSFTGSKRKRKLDSAFNNITTTNNADHNLVDQFKNTGKKNISFQLKILSYNVWFDESVALLQRINEISNIIENEQPNIICLQEVTHNIYRILSNKAWWRKYYPSYHLHNELGPYFVLILTDDKSSRFNRKPFPYSRMGRELLYCMSEERSILIATTHLESPTPPLLNEKERINQLKQSLDWLDTKFTSAQHPVTTVRESNTMASTSKSLDTVQDVILIGDLNWCEHRGGKMPGDGAIPFPSSHWVDAWQACNPQDPGMTYDTTTNPMLKGSLKGRLDRCLCRLDHWRLHSIRLVGQEPIPGVTYDKMYRGKPIKLPVLPSDHYGLLVTLASKESVT